MKLTKCKLFPQFHIQSKGYDACEFKETGFRAYKPCFLLLDSTRETEAKVLRDEWEKYAKICHVIGWRH